MYFVYLAKSIDVHKLAEQWGHAHNTTPDGLVQNITHALNLQDWKKHIKVSGAIQTPRIVYLRDATADDVSTVELTALLHEPEFQVIAYLSDEDAQTIINTQVKHQKQIVDEIFDLIKEDLYDGIENVGVSNRISVRGTTQINLQLSKKGVGKDAAAILKNRNQVVRERVHNELPLTEMVKLVK